MTGAALVAAGLAAASALLLRPVRPGAGRPGAWPALALVVVAAAVAGVPLLLRRSPVLLLALGVVAGAAALLRARRRAAAAEHRSAAVLEVCEVLADELAAGQQPVAALEAAGRAWPPVLEVARSARLGGSVPGVLRSLAEQPGAGDLRLVAAAWEVAHRTGGGLADALGSVALSLRERAASRRVVGAELASARATARLVAALPALTLLMGSGLGGAPVGFLLGTGGGLVLCAVGLGLGLLGLAWIEGIAGSVAGAET